MKPRIYTVECNGEQHLVEICAQEVKFWGHAPDFQEAVSAEVALARLSGEAPVFEGCKRALAYKLGCRGLRKRTPDEILLFADLRGLAIAERRVTR